MAKFSDLADEIKDTLNAMMSDNFYRNATMHPDGSMGEIKITPGELRELLTQAYLEGYHDH